MKNHPKQTLGVPLLSPLSTHQESREKVFFRTNTLILWELFNPSFQSINGFAQNINTASRPQSTPIYDTRTSSVTSLCTPRSLSDRPKTTRGEWNQNAYMRPKATPPLKANRRPTISLQQTDRPKSTILTRFAFNTRGKPFENDRKPWRPTPSHDTGLKDGLMRKKSQGNDRMPVQNFRDHSNRKKYSLCLSPGQSSLHKEEYTPHVRWSAQSCRSGKVHWAHRGNNGSESEDDDSESHNIESRTVSPSYAKLLEFRRHPPSVHCDTLGPKVCRHCVRAISKSASSFILPGTRVISSAKSTVRLPSPTPHADILAKHPKGVIKAELVPKQSMLLQSTPYSPLAVFLRTRHLKAENISRLSCDYRMDLLTDRGDSWRESKCWKETGDSNELPDTERLVDRHSDADEEDNEEGGDVSEFVQDDLPNQGVNIRVTFTQKSRDIADE